MPAIKHRFVSAKSDGADLTLVRPSSWNDDHLSAFEIRNARTDYGADATGATDTSVAIQNALNAGGLTVLPTGSYKFTSNITVPSGSFLMCQPDAELVASGASIVVGSKTASVWQIGISIRIRGSSAAGAALVELYNLLGSASFGARQIMVALTASTASEFVHVHSTNGKGYADVRHLITTDNFTCKYGIGLYQGDDTGIASVAGDFINGSTFEGTLGCTDDGIRFRGIGTVGGSVLAYIARNKFDRIDINSYGAPAGAGRGLRLIDAGATRNEFRICTFETGGGGAALDIDTSACINGQYFWHPICRALAFQSLVARDVWAFSEWDEPFNFGIATWKSNGIGFFTGAGAPGAGLGVNGDFYFNQTGGALTTIYQKRAGAWVGIV